MTMKPGDRIRGPRGLGTFVRYVTSDEANQKPGARRRSGYYVIRYDDGVTSRATYTKVAKA